MKKIYIIISILFLIIVGIVGYFMFFGKGNIWNKQHIEPIIPADPVVTYESKKIEIENNNNKNIELYNNAIQDQDPLICDAITDDDKKIDCHNNIITTTAKKTGSLETCDTITETGTLLLCKDSIYNNRAISTQNRYLCDEITDSDRKVFCQESVDELLLRGYIEGKTVTHEKCEELSEKFQEACVGEIAQIDETAIYTEALKKNDIELCKKITNEELKSTCLDTIYLKMAITKQDIALCKELQNQDKQLYCTNQVSKTNDVSQYKLAISNNDIDSCDKIITENLKNKCHDTIIITTVKSNKDITLCDSLTSTTIISQCKQIGQ